MNRNPLKKPKVNNLGSASLGYHSRQSLSISVPRQSLGTSSKVRSWALALIRRGGFIEIIGED